MGDKITIRTNHRKREVIDGFQLSDSFFSGTLVKYDTDSQGKYVIVGRYYS